MFQRDKSVLIHHRNIQFLAIELFKVKLGVAPPFMSKLFVSDILLMYSVVKGLRFQVDSLQL